jgi:Flp pilus assembly protein TadB
MTTQLLAAALCGGLIAGGIAKLISELRGVQIPDEPRRHRIRLPHLSRRTRLLLITGITVGLVAWLVTGWPLALVIAPAAIVGLPYLLSAPDAKDRIEVLEALEEWTRSLSGVLTVGLGLEQALITTSRSTPAPIAGEVGLLVARLRARWATEAAIRAFANDLDDATGDLVAGNLILAARRRGAGLAKVLDGLAESVAADVRARRQVEADRAKPRATARWVTIISATVLVVLGLTGSYIEPYGSPLGQGILAVLLTAYVATLLWMRRMAEGRRLPRIIGPPASDPPTPGRGNLTPVAGSRV